jgi:PadR family transcriptional regulator PadR
MLILKTLALEAIHGHGIAIRIEQISNGAFCVNLGSLLPRPAPLKRAGRLKAARRATENNRRAKYYLLTQSGGRSRNETRGRRTAAITRILES